MSDQYQLSGFISNKLHKVLLIIGVVFLGVSLLLYKTESPSPDSYRFLFSYLTSYAFFLFLSLSALFLVLVQFLFRAGWGVVVRRVPETLMMNIPIMVLLFLPLYFGLEHIYHWLDLSHVAHDRLLQVKQPYLNKTFLYIRLIAYFSIWIGIARYYYTRSIKQDSVGGEELTAQLQRRSAPCILLFALTFSFASFDLLMSLDPHWFSTIFGIYVFGNTTLAALCMISLIYLFLRKYGYLKTIVTVEHYHDLGKLIYGFVIFWAYIAFSQFFLIWYANIPEETAWYIQRFEGNWLTFTVILCLGHFVLPLFLFMSHHAKRNLKFHFIMVSLILFMCFLDMYFIVMPTISKQFSFSFYDVFCFIGIGSIYFSFFFNRLRKQNLIPLKDPRLSESLEFENT